MDPNVWSRAEYDHGAALAPEVVATLGVLLAGRDPVSIGLRRQVPFVREIGGCRCGCPSVGLEVDRDRVAPAPVRVSPPVEGLYEGLLLDVLLFTSEGYLASLELNWASDEPPSAWPDIGVLAVERRLSAKRNLV